MLRRTLSFLFFILFCTSCEYFSSNNAASKSNFEVSDTIIDFTKVDTYPIFPDCKNFAENDNQKECFYKMLPQKLTESLSQEDIKVKKAVNDTAWIDILIDNTGRASLVNVNSTTIINEQIPDFQKILKRSIDRLPPIEPAVTRGIFVKSQYRMAVEVKTI
ncbi:hypothetical protein UMM65_11470 [Aureibaculum sp. 2210JD6-5]|uniref:hypothetical protein n=1 Tax=Aureibaculum sp. 2210JD6-5 TaxID=3103957 RepID=UPI002AADDC6B|nr:hypothetical protein [Aureibaculum sp. 2210JD6-5]MDY7395866.1 hypothetical protein [Aureibaculum sp. 2210JD6-5]